MKIVKRIFSINFNIFLISTILITPNKLNLLIKINKSKK